MKLSWAHIFIFWGVLLVCMAIGGADSSSALKKCDRLLEGLSSGKLVTVGGHNLFVWQNGKGPDVVLLHGMGDSGIGWQFIAPRLVRSGYRVTVWDALGAGKSDKPFPGDYSLKAHIQRLEAILNAVGIQEAVFVGHSLGGSMALELAQKHSPKVRALFLIDPAAYREGAMGGRWFWNTPYLAETVLGLLPLRAIARIGLKQNFRHLAKIPPELEALYLGEARRPGAVNALMAQERQLIPPHVEQWEEDHRTIINRTFILWGREDKLVPLAQGHRLAQAIEDSRLRVLPGIGHSPHLEAPQMVLEQLLSFLQE
jgi:pimeloyl-ACP methyl ester carboxylesterase